ncbi:MAG: hypothetical protein Q9168_001849 [Polycauliona sp. 1 TL-2023]
MAPELIYGTATFAMDMTAFREASSVRTMLEALHESGVGRLDTGARYPPLKPGRSEELIGETKDVSNKLTVDTKVYADTKSDGSGDLTHDAIEKSVQASLKRLQRPQVSVLYAHRADPSTPLEEQIEGFNYQIKIGRCKAWGVSNTSPERLEEILRICETKGLQKPTCYQGDYNLVTRGMETKLLPLLRSHGMTFNAFRPLAAGFLTGKFLDNDYAGTRFSDDNPLSKPMQNLFGAQDLQAAVRQFGIEMKSHGLTAMEVAIRWIVHHSALQNHDGVIIGASKKSQFEETASMIEKGPLPKEVLETVESVWDEVKESRKDII